MTARTARRGRVVMVVPSATELEPDATLDANPTLTRLAAELAGDGRWEVCVVWATDGGPGTTTLERDDVAHRFEPLDQVAVAVLTEDPDVVHVHGTGVVTLLQQLRKVLPERVAVVVQHHGESPGGLRDRLAHKLLRSRVDAWLFTGADHGQAEPFRRAGVVPAGAVVREVLAAASLLDDLDRDPVALEGSPVVLWVGRLVEAEDPLTAVRAFALAATRLPEAQLHVLATDRTLEPEVRAAIAAAGIGHRVHLHPEVQHGAMSAWYAAADVLLSTRRDDGPESVVVEAVTAGCVPVVSGVPSHRSIVGDLAPTFPVGDASAAAELLVAGTTVDRGLVRRHAARTLSWAAVVDRLDAVYVEVRPPGR